MDILVTVLIVISAFLGFKFVIQKKAARSKGKQIDISIFDDEIKELLSGNKSILYFYTSTCSACKTQTPIIDKISGDTDLVGKIDLSQNRKAAKEFGIMGTPSTALMVGNKIAEIFIGVKQENYLREKFNQL